MKVKACGEHAITFICPGCGEHHSIPVKPHPQGWEFNGDADRPTIKPSIHVHPITRADGTVLTPRCHSYVTDGKIEYLRDCTHSLAGKTVDLPELT